MRSLALMMVLAAGCGNSSHPMVDLGPIQVDLGTSALDGSGFLPLTGDQTLVPGAQGGFHVWVKWKVAGMAPQKVHAARTVRRASDGELILTTEAATDVGPEGADGWWELPSALPSFMCPTPVGISVEDQTMKFQLVLHADDNGEPGAQLGEANATATPHCPTDDQQEFCQRICNG